MHPKDPIEGIVVAGKESPERHEGLRRTGWEGRDPRKGACWPSELEPAPREAD